MTRLHASLRAAAGTVAAVLLMSSTAVTAQEVTVGDQVNVGVAESAGPELKASAEAEKALKLDPTRRFEFADHVANGVAMRNRTAGTIHLRGAPVPSRVLAALLYFNFSDGSREGRRNVPILFDGNRIVADKTADHVDPCWGMAGNHSYVADVTRLLPIGGHLNQDYPVVVQFDVETSTTGQNPWSPAEPDQKVRVEGATLVVVYRTQDTTGSVFVYDALNDSMFAGTAQFDLLHPGLDGLGRFTMAGADGQRGFGHDNGASNELTFFNGSQIAGPPGRQQRLGRKRRLAAGPALGHAYPHRQAGRQRIERPLSGVRRLSGAGGLRHRRGLAHPAIRKRIAA